MTKYPFESSRMVVVNHNDGLGGMVDREKVLGYPTPIAFEGKKLMGMKDNDAYLTSLFGDYMTPPPIDKRQGDGPHGKIYINLEKNVPINKVRKLKSY